MTAHAKLIADHLAQPGATLTALDALRLWGCARLAARIHSLRSCGLKIESRSISVVGKNGPARIAEYYLARGGK